MFPETPSTVRPGPAETGKAQVQGLKKLLRPQGTLGLFIITYGHRPPPQPPAPAHRLERLTDGDEADGHPFSLVSRIRGGPIGPSPPWPRGWTLIHEEGRTGRCPRVLTDER